MILHKVINEKKQVEIGYEKYKDFYLSKGFTYIDENLLEQAYDGNWYLNGYCPEQPDPTYIEKRIAEYPSISDQLDMIYWDEVNGTTFWKDKITNIKNKYPKE